MSWRSDYPAWLRRELASLIAELDAGQWGELGVCPGPFGCPYATEAEARAAGVAEGQFCGGCRVILVYRA